ncbi:MAG TPA: tyrosinase family protein [Rhizomicrobium sp.]|nr:tyrosinase family protein [Rhizomicrobium sp.]
MKQTRRGFVGGAAAIGAGSLLPAMLPWAKALAQGHPTRQSLAEFSKDPTKVAALRRGVGVMKARAPSDHRSWFFQSAIHAYNDAAYADAVARDPGVAQVDGARFWNKCPHFGQSSAEFLVWHRAYLYAFERTLRDAIGDPLFALPYWDYSKEEGREFPAIFADEFLDAAKTQPNPLHHPNRESAFVTGRFDLSEEVGMARATMGAPNFFSDIGAPGFAGDILDSSHTQLGLIEQRPHNDIHIAVGGAIGSVNGAMADIPTAAFDPVFWVHHANIDRLWAEWECMPGKNWGPMPPDSWLDQMPWEFIDADGSILSQSRRFFMERINIAVFYDTDKAHGPPMPLPARAPVAVTMSRTPEEAAPPPPPPPPPPPTGAGHGVGGPGPGGGHARLRAPAPVAAGTPMAMAKPPVQDRELVADATPVVASPKKAGMHTLPVETEALAGRRMLAAPQPQIVGAAPPPRAAAPMQQEMAAPAPPPPPPPVSADKSVNAPGGAAAENTVETVVATGSVAPKRVILELSDISFKRVPSSGFAVYLASAEDIATNRIGTFVGLLDLFGVTHGNMAGMQGMKAVQRFDVTRIVAREGLALTIRVEPYDLLVSKEGHSGPKRSDAVKIGKVRFVEIASA